MYFEGYAMPLSDSIDNFPAKQERFFPQFLHFQSTPTRVSLRNLQAQIWPRSYLHGCAYRWMRQASDIPWISCWFRQKTYWQTVWINYVCINYITMHGITPLRIIFLLLNNFQYINYMCVTHICQCVLHILIKYDKQKKISFNQIFYRGLLWKSI